jgi:hypothetical protein
MTSRIMRDKLEALHAKGQEVAKAGDMLRALRINRMTVRRNSIQGSLSSQDAATRLLALGGLIVIMTVGTIKAMPPKIAIKNCVGRPCCALYVSKFCSSGCVIL